LAAVQGLYEIDMTGAAVDGVLLDALRNRWSDTPYGTEETDLDSGLFTRLVRGVVARRADLDRMIGAARGAESGVERMERVLRAIARAGAFELLENTDTPAKVVIDEYVSMAHAFFDGGEPKLVNAILDRLARQLRAGELESPDVERPAG
jgi:N utilization substance protein B